MRYKYLIPVIAVAILFSCKKERSGTNPPVPPPPPPPVPAMLLKDVVVASLPSPYYHFEYNAEGRMSLASFASGLTLYNIVYDGDRISEMKNNIIVNKDRLQYSYDNAGRVNAIRYADSTGVVYTRISLTYDQQKLIKMEREKKLGLVFVIDKTMSFLYHADGNVSEITEHRPQLIGQPEITYTTRFEQYDNKVNVDGFQLIHNEFFDHLVLLPGVQLRKNNPGKEIRTGSGINYEIEYTYIYNDRNFPLSKHGEFIITSGPNTGMRFQTNSSFTYY